MEARRRCDLALAAAPRAHAVAIDPLAVVFEISQRAQIQIVFAPQFFFQPRGFCRVITVSNVVFVCCFHGVLDRVIGYWSIGLWVSATTPVLQRSRIVYVSLNSASITSSPPGWLPPGCWGPLGLPPACPAP